MKRSAGKIQLTGFDDLFHTKDEAEASGERVQEIPLSELFSFKDHPFHVRDDEAMQQTADSIAKYGVLVPGIVRPRQEGGYEIVAGHRRKRGSELAGKSTMPVIVRDLDDDEATIIMVDSNLQRERILPSEKAFAYKMKLEALKHQGKRWDITSAPAVQKLTARDKIAQDAGEKSGMAVARYISLTKLGTQLKAVNFSNFNVADALEVIKADIMEEIRQANRGCSAADLVFYFTENFPRNFTQGALLIAECLTDYYRTGELIVYDYVGENYDPVEHRISEFVVTEADLHLLLEELQSVQVPEHWLYRSWIRDETRKEWLAHIQSVYLALKEHV